MPSSAVSPAVRDFQRKIRLFMLAEGVTFATVALVHAGVIPVGSLDPIASIAESVIAVVLLAAFGLTFISPARARAAGLGAQGFALAFTLVGTYFTLRFPGVSTMGDAVFHVVIVFVLLWGLVVAARTRIPSPGRSGA
ncbi:MAG: hypothetical protein ACRDGT_04370 [Candidatus Limnocylindria bacterium]